MIRKDDSSWTSVVVVIGIVLVLSFFNQIKNFISCHFNITIPISNYQFLGIVLFVISGALCFRAIHSFVKYIRSKRWKRIKGKVISSKLEVEQGENNKIYTPKVEFKYTLNGVTYVSSELYPVGSMGVSVKRFSMRIVNRYKPGTAVMVYVNPDNPTDSFLERKGVTASILAFLIGLLILMSSVMLICGIIDDHFNVLK